MLGIEPELAVSVVSNTITDIHHCMNTDVTVQHNRTPSDLVSVVAMTDQLAKVNREKGTPPQLARW